MVVGDGAEVDKTAVDDLRQAAAGDWPRWLGPHGDGVSQETDWSSEWVEDGPAILWEKNVGLGYSSVAVVGDRLYTMGNFDKKEEVVVCLDASSGERIWEQRYPGGLVAHLHQGGTGATPTISDGMIFTLGREGQLRGANAESGDLVWEKDVRKELNVNLPEWGFTCSPLALGDVVIVDAGPTAAFARDSGELVWKTTNFAAGYGTPTAFLSGDEPLLAVLNNDYLMVVSPKDGSIRAKIAWETQYDTNATTPIARGDEIFISTGYNRGCALLKFADNRLDFVYENREMRNHFNNCVFHDGYLYGIDGQSHSSRNCKLVCMRWTDGEVAWSKRGYGCGSVTLAGDRLIVLSEDGRLAIGPASPDGFTPTAEAQVLDGTCWTAPVLSHGRIYCRGAQGRLVCVDVRQ
jgi:outer membrane protein assembly factor BamB